MSTLAQLKPGDSAEISSVDGTDEITARLMEMGLTPGVHLQMIGVAPLGDPLEFELRGYRLSLRKSEAARVVVK